MVTNEENDSEPSDESSGDSEERRSPSRDYSAGQSRPTSRGRPGRDDDDDDQDEDTTESTQDQDVNAEESTDDRTGDSEEDTASDSREDLSEEPETVEESPSADSIEDSENDQTEPDAAERSELGVEEESVESTEASGTEVDEAPESTETPDEEKPMYGELDEFRGFSIFEGLGPEAIEIVIEGSERISLRDGETLFEEEDEPNDCFYLILEGEIKIMKFMRTETTQVTTLEDGDYFGEFGMFTGKERMAGAESRGSTTVLEIPRSTVEELRQEDAEALVQIYENMFQTMAKRFKAMAQKAEKSQFWL